jgi:hypothetical protein
MRLSVLLGVGAFVFFGAASGFAKVSMGFKGVAGAEVVRVGTPLERFDSADDIFVSSGIIPSELTEKLTLELMQIFFQPLLDFGINAGGAYARIGAGSTRYLYEIRIESEAQAAYFQSYLATTQDREYAGHRFHFSHVKSLQLNLRIIAGVGAGGANPLWMKEIKGRSGHDILFQDFTELQTYVDDVVFPAVNGTTEDLLTYISKEIGTNEEGVFRSAVLPVSNLFEVHVPVSYMLGDGSSVTQMIHLFYTHDCGVNAGTMCL